MVFKAKGKSFIFAAYKKKLKLELSGIFTLISSLSVYDTLCKLGIKPWIKWPNDVYVENRKIAGILNEVFPEGLYSSFFVIGIGLNVNGDFRGSELEELATSIYMETGRFHDRFSILLDFLNLLDVYIKMFHEQGPGAIRRKWEEKSKMWDRKIQVEGLERAKPIGIDDFGYLVVDLDGKKVKIGAGDLYVLRD